ncbi:MAG: hypothetical protein ACYCXB_06680 [Candidatus Humimicrobiaceae bacterium]
MVKIVRLMVIVLALLLMVAIFLPGCNSSTSKAENPNPIGLVSNSGISNIKNASKDNNVIEVDIDYKEQISKFCNDLRLQFNKNSESNSN